MPLPSENNNNPVVGTGYYSSADGVDKAGRSWLGANGYWDQFLGVGTNPNVSVELVTDFKVGDNTYHSGNYTIDDVFYSDPKNKDGLTIRLQDSQTGQQFEVPYNFVSVKDPSGKVISHEDYVPLWTNSKMSINMDKNDPRYKYYDESSLPSGSIVKDNPDAQRTGYNTFQEVITTDKSEVGVHARESDYVSGARVVLQNEDGTKTPMSVPYSKGEKVIINNQEYTVGDYTGAVGGPHGADAKLTIVDANGQAHETTVSEMKSQGAKVVESEIPVGAKYGLHEVVSKEQAEMEKNRTVGRFSTAQIADQKAGTTVLGQATINGKATDVYVTYDGKGGYTVINKETGQPVKDVKNTDIKLYNLEAGDGHGIQGAVVGKPGAVPATSGDSKTVVQSGSSYYEIGNTTNNPSEGKQYVIDVDGKPTVVTLKSFDNYSGARPGEITYHFVTADGKTINMSARDSSGKIKEASAVDVTAAPAGSDVSPYEYSNNGYRVTGTVVDEGNAAVGRAGGTSQAIDRKDIYDNYMWDHNITQTGSLPGVDQGVQNYANPKEAIDTLVNSQQWTRQDARKYVQDLAANGQITFASKTTGKTEYYSSYQTLHNEIKNGQFSASASQLRSEVSTLRSQCDALLSQMDSWAGSAKESAMRAIRSVQGKLQVTMGNIEQALEPACYAIENLDEKLEELKKQDEILKELIEKEEKAAEAEAAAKATLDGTPKTKSESYTENGEKKTRTVDNPAYATAKAAYDEAVAAHTAATEEKEAQQVLEDEMEEEILEMIELVQDLQQVIQQFKSFVDPNGANHHMVSSAANIEKYYNDIIYEFENFTRLPAITNASDYQVGDIVLFDDGYGYLYKVVEVFDGDGKATGYVKIIRCDENGKPIAGAPVLTIWDQREITPIRGGRQLWQPPTTVPVTPTQHVPPTITSVPPTTTKPPVPPKPPTTHTPVPPKPPTWTPPTWQPPTWQPPTWQPPTWQPPTWQPPTWQPPTFAPPPPPPPQPEPTRIPGPPTPVPPPPTVIPTQQIEVIPHTGIDVSLGGTGDNTVKQSSAGALGALAGIMAGAAGIGLTALAKDDDKEEKEDSEEGKEENKE